LTKPTAKIVQPTNTYTNFIKLSLFKNSTIAVSPFVVAYGATGKIEPFDNRNKKRNELNRVLRMKRLQASEREELWAVMLARQGHQIKVTMHVLNLTQILLLVSQQLMISVVIVHL
jgi:hypothetical protein